MTHHGSRLKQVHVPSNHQQLVDRMVCACQGRGGGVHGRSFASGNMCWECGAGHIPTVNMGLTHDGSCRKQGGVGALDISADGVFGVWTEYLKGKWHVWLSCLHSMAAAWLWAAFGRGLVGVETDFAHPADPVWVCPRAI